MLKNYFLSALRNLVKNKFSSILNILGLAVGISSFIFIVLFIVDEINYDRYHSKSKDIYRACRLLNTNDLNENSATCSFPFAPTLENDYPDIVKNTVRFFNLQVPKILIEFDDKRFNEKRAFFVDSTVFSVFDWELVSGDRATALNEPFTVIITETIAKKYFGDEDPIGKTLRVEEAAELVVKGVAKDVPRQSHFQWDFLISMSTFRQFRNGQLPQTWIWNPCWTYVELFEGLDPDILNEKLPVFYETHYDDFKNEDITLYLQPLEDIHLTSHLEYEINQNSFISYIYILSAIAIFILVIACINFMNLATATSTNRAKEIGVKKVFGAQRGSLIFQFLNESILVCLISMLIALGIVEILLPTFNNFTDKDFASGIVIQPIILISILALTFVVGILAGIYPAFFLSAFNPIKVLKGNKLRGSRGKVARKSLVIAQFVISTALIIGTLIIFSQLNHLRNKDLGFEKEQIIIVPTVNPIKQSYEAFVAELKKSAHIENVTGSDYVLGLKHNTYALKVEGLDPDKTYFHSALMVRHDFIKTYGLEIVAGRDFSSEYATDTSKAIIINEAMARSMNWTNEEALGKHIQNDGDEIVIGIVKDFNALSLHKTVDPFILDMIRFPRGANFRTNYVAIRVNTNDYSDVLQYIEEAWKKFAPTRPFEYTFFNTDLDAQYRNEEKLGEFSAIMTFLTIFIAALGLFGLVSFMAEQRTKEIGIRKVMGGTVMSIVKMLSKEFITLILIANVIAWPIIYFMMKNWLKDFSDQVPINILFFVITTFITLFLAILISGYRAYIASNKNPIDTLRYE
jgi:putative ABC transport system permease protein